MQHTGWCSSDINLKKKNNIFNKTCALITNPTNKRPVMKARITSRLTRGRNTGSKHRWARGATDGNRRENPRLGITNWAKEGGRIILQNKTGNNPNTQHEVDTFNQMKKDTWKERKKGNRPNGKLWRGNIQPAAVKYNQIDKKKNQTNLISSSYSEVSI